MRKTRKVISTMLAIVIAFSVFAVSIGSVFSFTLINQEFLTKHFVNSNVVQQCEQQLVSKYKALEKKSNIPSKVFEKVLTDMPVAQSMTLAIDNFYNGHDATMYSVDKVDYFYDICTEYLDANNIKYNSNDIEQTAQQAAEIYSDCVGLHNIEYLRTYINEMNAIIRRISSVSLLTAGICALLLFVLHGYKVTGIKYAGSAVFGAGFGGMLSAFICIVGGIGKDLSITPVTYQQGMDSCVNWFYACFFVFSFAVSLLGAAGLAYYIRTKIIADQRKNARFFKRIDIINK